MERNKRIATIVTTTFFSLIICSLLFLFNSNEFDILNVEGSPDKYIFIYTFTVICIFISPLVIIYSMIMLKK
ncbi:hypothetical protein PEC301645_20650 [Pectobacterium carotovorum subsp. carotovorum]|nr:hypothetical protein PEC301645_20650 [Pectobacterium carotovorum subsp. carotovorum]